MQVCTNRYAYKIKYSHPHTSNRNTKPQLKYGGDYTTKSKQSNTILSNVFVKTTKYQENAYVYSGLGYAA